MKTTCSIALCLLFSAQGWTTPISSLPRSISTSRQFIVYGGDAPLRGALCNLAERTKATLLALLQQSDGWKTPIVIHAQYPQANLPETPRAALYFSQTGFGLKIQLDLVIGADISGPAVERELLRALILELMYRRTPNLPSGTPYMQPPDWLLEGILAFTPDREPATLAEMLKGPVAANKVMPLEQFFQHRLHLLDSPSQQLFSAYSYALVALLTDGAENRARFAQFIAALPDSPNDAAADLRAHFPALAGAPGTAEKAWTSIVARVSALDRHLLYSIPETERRLEEILRLKIADNAGRVEVYRLEDYPRFIDLPARAAALNIITSELMLLGTRSNPLYRPIILGYQEIASRLARKTTRRVAQRLRQLGEARKEIGTRAGKIADYLNWFEATQSQTRSGAFADYLKAAERARDPEPRRRDAISVYLDALGNAISIALYHMHHSLNNTIDYLEMPTRDLAATKRFFAELFGWTFTDYGPDYASFDDGRMTGGFFQSEKTVGVDAGSPLIVFYHEALEEIRAKVTALGGRITRDIFDFPGGRRFHFHDPGDGEFAVWSDK